MNDLLKEEIWEDPEGNDWTGEYMEDEIDEVIRDVLRREMPDRKILKN